MQLLRLLIQELSVASLPAVRDLLQSVHPLLGATKHGTILAKATLSLRINPAGRNEVEVRRRQLLAYLAEREAAVADEVRQAAASVRTHYQLAVLAYAREQSWAAKAQEVLARKQQGLASFAELTSAKLEMLKARPRSFRKSWPGT